MYTITVINEYGQKPQFNCRETESLLDAANRHGIKIPYACKGGGCGMCKIKVEVGEFERKKSSKAVLPDHERELNFTLACKTYPKSHVTIFKDLSKSSNSL